MNLTKKQIDIIRELTPKKLIGKQISSYRTLGYYRPYSANWAYEACWVEYKGTLYLVVRQFGQIV